MEIIKHGKKKFKATCRECGCVFTYTIGELRERWPLKYIHCPDCDAAVYHEDQTDNNESAGAETSNECPLCGTPLVIDKSVVYTSDPPQYKEVCPKCGYSRFTGIGRTIYPTGTRDSLTGTPATIEGSSISGSSATASGSCRPLIEL